MRGGRLGQVEVEVRLPRWVGVLRFLLVAAAEEEQGEQEELRHQQEGAEAEGAEEVGVERRLEEVGRWAH
jgi:hypothetical protein